MKHPTRLNHPPEVRVPEDNRALVAPIYQSVKFTFDSVEESQRQSRGERDGFVYSRVSNPTLRQLELTLAELQNRESCLVTASGVAAVHLAIMALCKAGDHIVFFAEMYQPTRYSIRRLLARFGVRSTMLSVVDTAAVERTLAETPTRLVVFESPSNPVLKIADIEAITTSAHRVGALTVLDNTFAGFHNHGQFAIDVFVHSLTKYAAGHGDVMGGAIIASKALIDSMRADYVVTGPTLDPHTAYLIQRGLKTYTLRYERQCENAMRIARYLSQRRDVANLRYPGLDTHPQHALAVKQMHDFGTIVTFDLQRDRAGVRKFCDALKLFAISASLGSTESLVQPGELMRPRDLTDQERLWAAVTDETIRLSLGIEDADDLIADLEQAFNA